MKEIEVGDEVTRYCDLCDVPILLRIMENDYPKGWHTVSRKILKPFEERRIQAPECDELVYICTDCTGKSLEPIITKARIRTAKYDLEWLEKRIKQDEDLLKRVTTELGYDIKEGTRLVPLMKDHIKQLEEKGTSTFDYLEHGNWEKQRREHN